ncbi:hypothetical protein DDB_G0279701 [Dictyostelium discoideum AX4]|uniref:Uncharacterized protein n=1 Tax=Dictyostelium discoideum TaxID=44689 RepID=Q54WE6_DICDI|nr:hypothetical protein DDB_G0279701 [Dictyostelium discoideum AX4]EAL67625.1 hypothetical protein DDB_G0279701 [Dictyostelium discoideum AX4]|eukprot:XP_641607.1 hypothetical protein DDB_G0279701 [Dictyostelium discoideum AX4]
MRHNKQNLQQKQQQQQQQQKQQQQKQQQQQQQKQQQQQQQQQKQQQQQYQQQQQQLLQQQQQLLQSLQTQNLDKDVVLTYNSDSWKAYTYIYDVAIDNLINLHVPTISDFQKELSCDVATNEVIRSAFYCAFHTKQRIINNNSNYNNLQQQQPPIVVEDIYINQSWFDYFSSRIQYKSSNRCLFKVKRFKKNVMDDLLNTKNSFGGKGKESSNSNNLFKKVKINEFEEENLLFKPQQPQQQQASSSSKTLLDNSEEILRVDDENDDSVLRYRYEKDFILLKDNKPLIISLSPDWGIPFHTKEVIDTSPTPIPLPQVFSAGSNNTNSNNNNKNNNRNKVNTNNNNINNNNNSSRSSKNNNGNKKDEEGESWCGIM